MSKAIIQTGSSWTLSKLFNHNVSAFNLNVKNFEMICHWYFLIESILRKNLVKISKKIA